MRVRILEDYKLVIKGDEKMHNMVYLIGRIANNVEVKEVNNDKQLSVVNVAVQRSYKNEDGVYETDFFPVVLWNGIANNVCDYCVKGDLLGIKGRLQHSSYEVDGEMKSKIEIIADKVTFLSSKKSEA